MPKYKTTVQYVEEKDQDVNFSVYRMKRCTETLYNIVKNASLEEISNNVDNLLNERKKDENAPLTPKDVSIGVSLYRALSDRKKERGFFDWIKALFNGTYSKENKLMDALKDDFVRSNVTQDELKNFKTKSFDEMGTTFNGLQVKRINNTFVRRMEITDKTKEFWDVDLPDVDEHIFHQVTEEEMHKADISNKREKILEVNPKLVDIPDSEVEVFGKSDEDKEKIKKTNEVIKAIESGEIKEYSEDTKEEMTNLEF